MTTALFAYAHAIPPDQAVLSAIQMLNWAYGLREICILHGDDLQHCSGSYFYGIDWSGR
jgi:hypothetical protein